MAVEFGLVHETRGLLARTTEKHRPTGGAKAAGQILERCQPRGINRGHIPQAQDHNGRQLVETVCYLGDLVGYSEEKWPVDAEHGDIRGNLFVLQNMDSAVFDVFVCYLRNGGGDGNLSNERKSSEQHADLDREAEICDYGERHGEQPDADVPLRQLQNLRDFLPITHVVGHHQQDAGKRRKRHVFHERRGEQHHCQERQRVDHARDGCLCS